MAGVGTTGIFLTVLAFAFRDEEEIEVSVEQIVRFERANGAEITV
jgi:cytochrome o ubiquinol oxidase subunit I